MVNTIYRSYSDCATLYIHLIYHGSAGFNISEPKRDELYREV
jgi:hypothetical protein